MAYREFYKGIETPEIDYSPIERGVSGLFRSLNEIAESKKRKSDAFSYVKEKGISENDNILAEEEAKNVISMMRTGLMKGDRKLVREAEKSMYVSDQNQKERRKQAELFLNAEKVIKNKSTENKYYRADLAEQDLVKSFYGEDGEENSFTRRPKLEQTVKNLEKNPRYFNIDTYTADWVKTFGDKEKERTTGTVNSTTSKYNKSPFWNQQTGAEGVTDDVIVKYLKSFPDGEVVSYIEEEVSKQLDDEIKTMKSSKDIRNDWMNGLSDIEIKNRLINKPSDNLVNKSDFNTRVNTLAKKRLEDAASIKSKVDVEYKNNTNGKWSNPNIVHTDSETPFAAWSTSNEGQKFKASTAAPGGKFTQKNGSAMLIETTNPKRYNVDQGYTVRNSTGSLSLKMNDYRLMPMRGDDPVIIPADNVDEWISKINTTPFDAFKDLDPELKLVLGGYTINEASVLGDVNDRVLDISTQLNEARKNNDKEKEASLMEMKNTLDEIESSIEAGGYNDRELIFSMNSAGIKKGKDNWLVKASDTDLATIRNNTGGFDLRDPKYYSDAMVRAQEAYKKRYQEAQAAGFNVPQEAAPAKGKAKAKATTTLKDSYNINGKGYSLDALKKLGYTEDQILEAAKLGTIK